MNQETNEYFSKVEKYYDLKLKRVTKCPITGQEGQPVPGNPLVWYTTYRGKKGEQKPHAGRILQAESCAPRQKIQTYYKE